MEFSHEGSDGTPNVSLNTVFGVVEKDVGRRKAARKRALNDRLMIVLILDTIHPLKTLTGKPDKIKFFRYI